MKMISRCHIIDIEFTALMFTHVHKTLEDVLGEHCCVEQKLLNFTEVWLNTSLMCGLFAGRGKKKTHVERSLVIQYGSSEKEIKKTLCNVISMTSMWIVAVFII